MNRWCRTVGAHPRDRLTALAARRIGPGKHADGGGLYLQVDDSGARRWILRITHHGRRRELGIGPFPLISLAEAREMAREMRKIARAGGDPIAWRDRGKRRSPSFEEAARTVHREHILPHSRSERQPAIWWRSIERYALPIIGAAPVHTVEQSDILRVLAPVWTEKPETARKLKQRLRTILDWAQTAGHRDGANPVERVEKGLPKQRDRAVHHKAVPWGELPEVVSRICEVDGMGALALRFTILTAVRSGETRGATWDEIDIDNKVWTVPEARMKGGREHRVPLSDAAVEVLEQKRKMYHAVSLGRLLQQMHDHVYFLPAITLGRETYRSRSEGGRRNCRPDRGATLAAIRRYLEAGDTARATARKAFEIDRLGTSADANYSMLNRI